MSTFIYILIFMLIYIFKEAATSEIPEKYKPIYIRIGKQAGSNTSEARSAPRYEEYPDFYKFVFGEVKIFFVNCF